MTKLAEANYYESIVAALDKSESSARQSGEVMDFAGLLEEYRVGASAYKTSMARFMSKAKEVNTYDIVQPTISWA